MTNDFTTYPASCLRRGVTFRFTAGGRTETRVAYGVDHLTEVVRVHLGRPTAANPAGLVHFHPDEDVAVKLGPLPDWALALEVTA